MTEIPDLYTYGVTLTTADGFSEPQQEDVFVFVKRISPKVVLVLERGKSGKPHFHMCIDLKPKQANKVTVRFVKFYEDLHIPFQKGVSVVVKSVKNRMGWLAYMAKEIPPDARPLLVQGYQWGNLKKQFVALLKKQKAAVVKGTDFTMNMDTAPNRIIDYAKRTGHLITGKDSFCTLMAVMMEDGYLVHRLKPKVLYAAVLAKLGYRSVAYDYWSSELSFS